MQPLYTWSGHRRLADTIVHNKRWIEHEDERHGCSFDVRRWVHPPGDETMAAAWKHLDRAHRRSLANAQDDDRHDLVAKVVWRFVVEAISYQRDQSDFWQFPSETLVLRSGDCEDKAFLCASLLLAAGIPESRVRVVIGLLRIAPADDSQPPLFEGHGWPMYLQASGHWCILEPNLPRLPVSVTNDRHADPVVPQQSASIHRATFLPADRLAANGCREQYVPLVCLNHDSVWTVEPRDATRISDAQPVLPHWTSALSFHDIVGRTVSNPNHVAWDSYPEDEGVRNQLPFR